jgi:hypothetical protein
LPDTPVVKAIQILIPDKELACFTAEEAEPMAWIPAPGEKRAVVFTLFIAEPANAFAWENPESNGNLLGTITCSTRSTWLVHTNQELDVYTLKMIEGARLNASHQAGALVPTEGSEGLRMTIWGHGAREEDVFFVELDAKNMIQAPN